MMTIRNLILLMVVILLLATPAMASTCPTMTTVGDYKTCDDGFSKVIMWDTPGNSSYNTDGNSTTFEYFIVASGGPGGNGNGGYATGSGGAAGIVNGTTTVGAGSYSIYVGKPSSMQLNGNNSFLGSLIAFGGGHGGDGSTSGAPGASGGGASHAVPNIGGAGVAGQGYAGGDAGNYYGASGGAYSGIGRSDGTGVFGVVSWITGAPVNYSCSAGSGWQLTAPTGARNGGCAEAGRGGINGVSASTASTGYGMSGAGTGGNLATDPSRPGTQGVVIIKFTTAPTADFTQNQTAGLYPLVVGFTDTSTGTIDSYNWSIYTTGSSPTTPKATTRNFTYLFSSGGNYTVNFTVTGAGSTSTKRGYVDIWNITSGDFAANDTAGITPLVVLFTPTVYNTTTYNWSFGDGNVSTDASPTHTYNVVGVFDVKLLIGNGHNETWINKTAYITVSPLPIFSADYTITNQVGLIPLTTTVTDTSTNTSGIVDLYNWTFGDGTQSFLQNPPPHIYTSPGIYEINLTITNTTLALLSYKASNVTALADLNPDSTYRFKPDTNVIRNITIYNRTIQLVNVNNASFANGTMLFDQDHVIVTKVLANKSQIGTITMTQSSINNTTGVVIFNVTNTSGFNTGATPVSIVDVEMLYDRYSAGDMTGAWGNGYLGNITYGISIPVTNLVDTPLNYSWTTFSNFTVSDHTPTVFEDPVTFTPVDNTFAADRYLYDFDDGETFLSHNRTGVWHIYSTSGTYSPNVTAYLAANASVTNTTRLLGSVVASYNTTYVNADFSGTPVTGSTGLNVQFTDLTVWGNTSANKIYNWSFGDGTNSASAYSDLVGNPTHVYTALGTYTVRLQVNNTRNVSLGSDIEEKINYIVISSSQSTTWYTQHLVQLKAVDRYGVPLSYSNISVRFLASGLPDTSVSWVQSAFGVSETVAKEMADNSYIMEIPSGSDGSATFMMFPGFSYGVTVTNVTSGVNHYTTILPADSSYVIYCPTSEQQVTTNQTLTQLVNTSIYVTEPNNSYVIFHILYQDTSGLTTNVRWNVTQWDNRTPMHYKDFGNPGKTLIYDNYTAQNVRGQEWKFWYNATRSAIS